MNSFLKSLAEYSLNNFGEQTLKDICYVFPGRRSGVFFKNYLMQSGKGSFWLPEILTISEFFSEFSKLEIADPVDISFELYKIYSKLSKRSESYDDFYYWGEMMINDFDDIDKYLVPAEKLFTNISDLKEIEYFFGGFEKEQLEVIREFWKHFNINRLSQEQKKFLDSWELLYPLYTGLRDSLMQMGTGYEGMLYRKAAAEIENGNIPELPWQKIVFAGFNALSSAEKVIFRYFRDSGKGLFFWDYDEEYISDINAEAGRFLRKNLKDFPADDIGLTYNSLKEKKDIKIVEIPSDVLQAKYLGTLLSEIKENITDNFDNTAIILCDENLLEPVISSLPENIPHINITMGYPLAYTNACSFTLHLLELQKNLSLQKYKKDRGFYFRDVLSILNHQYLHYFMHSELQELINKIQSHNMIYIPGDFFSDNLFLKSIFVRVFKTQGMSAYIRNILTQLLTLNFSDGGPEIDMKLEKEYLLHIVTRVNKLEKIFEKYSTQIPGLFYTTSKAGDIPGSGNKENNLNVVNSHNERTEAKDEGIIIYSRILGKLLRSARIPFEGEPLQGLQIMGVLESRLLDFRNVIYLSMNEGIMPRSLPLFSFIPPNLRYAFLMPVREDQDAIYAYYFYRLLQRAENVTLMYNSKSDGLKSGEKSRYLYQLEYLREPKPEKKTIAFHISAPVPQKITIRKNEDIMRKMGDYLNGGSRSLAPTALTAWLYCRLRFYFSNITGIQEKDEIIEEIDAPLLGNIVHHAMRQIYKNYRGMMIDIDTFRSINNIDFINSCINHAFLKEFNKANETEGLKFIPEGRNLIVYEVIKRLIGNILEYDSKQLPFKIVDLEKKYEMVFSAGRQKIRLSGVVDRVDIRENIIHIIDYKTGKVNQNFPSVQNLFDTVTNDKYKEIFQTFLYSYIYQHAVPGGNKIAPCIYAVRNINKNEFTPYLKISVSPAGINNMLIFDFSEYSDEFEKYLTETLIELFDPSVDFTQTEESKRCEFCPYNKICHRDQTRAEF